jgi:hypothetical protein
MKFPDCGAVKLPLSEWRLIRKRVTEGIGKPPEPKQFRFFMERVAMLARLYRFQHQLRTGLSRGSMLASLSRLHDATGALRKAIEEMDGYTPIFLGQFLGKNFNLADFSKQLSERLAPALTKAIKFIKDPVAFLEEQPSGLADVLTNQLCDQFGTDQVIFCLAIAFRNSFHVAPVCKRNRTKEIYEGNFYGAAVAVTQAVLQGVGEAPLSPLTIGKYATRAISGVEQSGLFGPPGTPGQPPRRGKPRYRPRT